MKKIEKDSNDFWDPWFLTWKIDFESQILALFDSSPFIQNSKFNNFLCWFLGKNLSNFVSPFENSTTRIAIIISKKFRGKNTFHVRQQLKATSSRHTPVTTMKKKAFRSLFGLFIATYNIPKWLQTEAEKLRNYGRN